MSTIPTLNLDLRFSYKHPEVMRIPRSPRRDTPATTSSTVGPLPSPRSTSSRAKPKPRVLILGRILAEEEVHAELESVARVHNLIATPDMDVPSAIQHAATHHGPFEAVGAVFSNDPFPWRYGPAQFSALAPHTKLYANPGAGYDTVDVDWITSTGAYFANAPLEVGRRTADATISLILTITRGLSTQFLHARAGGWKDPSIKALDWRGKTLGILGLGNIGSQVADMATGLGFKVIYSNRHEAADEPYEFVSREELFKRADVLLLLTPLTDETRGLINKKTIAELKDGVIIVNVSRGPVVVEQDLVDALKSGKVLRAALDVFEHEPEIHPELLVNPNVLITPHVAAFTEDISIKSANEVFENIIQFLRTGKPNTPVNDPKP